MPGKAGLTGQMWAGFYGKHPGFGDFITAGLPQPALGLLEPWLPAVLSETRSKLGIDWAAQYDAARPVRFWIGADLALGDAPMCGVLMSSRDAVGRRFPWLICWQAAHSAPPPAAPDQAGYADIESWAQAQLAAAAQPDPLLELADLEGALRDQLSAPASDPAEDAAGSDTLWAINPTGDVRQVLGEAVMADYARAARARSYWWCAADATRASAVWSCSGLPTADAFGWLLTGVPSHGENAADFGSNSCDTPFTPEPEAVEKPAAEDEAL